MENKGARAEKKARWLKNKTKQTILTHHCFKKIKKTKEVKRSCKTQNNKKKAKQETLNKSAFARNVNTCDVF